MRRAGRLSITIGLVVAASLAWTGPAAAGSGTATLVRVIDTSTWSPPSPDPSGIGRAGGSRRFVVVDGEVDETQRWHGANVWSTRGSLSPTASWSTRRYSDEPTDVAMPTLGRMFISDDSHNQVFEIRRGRDHRFGTADDVRTSLSTARFGSLDTEGLAYGRRTLFVADGVDRRIYRIGTGADGRFGGGTRDVVVSRFGVRSLGLSDPEGVAYAGGHLYVVSRRERLIVETDLDGHLIATFDIGDSEIEKPSGIAVVIHDGTTRAYVTDRGIDNNVDRDENDGEIYVYELS